MSAINRLRAEDLDRLMEIENTCFAAPWARESFEKDLRNPAARYIALREDGVLQGYAGVWFLPEMAEAHVTSIAVMPELRRRGEGERLMRALMQLSADCGMRWMSLECRRSNVTAQDLYHKLGFIDVGWRKRYYENGEDALVMARLSLPEGHSEDDADLIRE